MSKLILFDKGLGVYGSESESSDEDNEEHSSGHKQPLKQDSDEAIQVNNIYLFLSNMKKVGNI